MAKNNSIRQQEVASESLELMGERRGVLSRAKDLFKAAVYTNPDAAKLINDALAAHAAEHMSQVAVGAVQHPNQAETEPEVYVKPDYHAEAEVVGRQRMQFEARDKVKGAF